MPTASCNPHEPSRTLAILLIALAGLPQSLHAQPLLLPQPQPQPQPLLNPQANPQANQQLSLRKVFVDEAISAKDALTRVREMLESDNLGEATRVLTAALAGEAEQLLPTEADPSLYIPVRDVVHAMLLADQPLLERFRTENEPIAADQLAKGNFRQVERERLLTTSGFEAALRLSQTEMESARFWSAWRVLAQLETHPDMQGPRAADALALGEQIAALLQSDTIRATLTTWRTKFAIANQPQPQPISLPTAARLTSTSPLDSFPAPTWKDVAATPLQSWPFSTPAQDEEDDNAEQRLRQLMRQTAAQPRQRAESTPWIFPAVVGNVVYINDSRNIAAFDAATLSLLWRTQPTGAFTRNPATNFAFGTANSRALEDIAGITAARGMVLAVTGQPINSDRSGDGRLHALDAATGQVKWSLDLESLDERLQGASVRGLPVIEGDVVVVGVRRPGLLRRVTTLYMVGLDLYTGRLRWMHAVGSVGTQPWSVRGTNRADTTTLHQGVVYRGDEMSVLGAYDAGTGRPLWVRVTTPIPELDATMPMVNQRTSMPYQLVQPMVILRGTTPKLFFLEPTEQRDVLELNAATGQLISRRTGAELGTPEYITRVGDNLAFVANFGLSFLNVDRFADGKLITTGTIEQVGFSGRATALGDRLAVPIVDGLLTVDPTNPNKFDRVRLAHTGNLVVVQGESANASDTTANTAAANTVLTASTLALHSYLPWDSARTMLTARIQRDSKNPQPMLAFIELALTQGQPELVPDLADRALRAISQDTTAHTTARQRLFRTLAQELAQSRSVAQAADRAPDRASDIANPPAQTGPKPITDLALLTQLEKRLALAAESPGERVTALFERAWLQEALQQPVASVEALQEVLADETLASVDVTRLELPGMSSDRTSAADTATHLLAQALTKSGPAPYALFDEEAQRAFDTLPAQPTYAQLARLARQYPFAAVTPRLWQLAADAATKAGNAADARSALGLGLQACIINSRIGREGQTPLLGDLLSSLMVTNPLTEMVTLQPLQRLLLSLGATTPALRVTLAGQQYTPAQAADLLAQRAAPRRHALMASTFEPTAQLIEGWEVLTPIDLSRTPAATDPARDIARDLTRDIAFDAVVMISRDERRIALFATSAIDGSLSRLWERDADVRPTIVRVGVASTVLLWPRPGAAQLEAISNLDGSSTWLAPTFAEIPQFAQGDADQRPGNMGTPLDGIVRGDDLLISSNGTHAIMTERRGRCAVVELATGKVLWAGTTGLASVFDTEFTDTAIIFVGAKPDEVAKRNLANITCVDLRTGQPRWQAQGKPLGDHARWANALPGGDVLVGTSGGVLRLRAADGTIAWQSAAADVRSSLSAWILRDRAIVLNGDFDLFAVTLDTGVTSTKRIDVRDRLMLPFTSAVIDDSLLLGSSLGMVVINGEGELAGADALDSENRLEPAVFAGNHAVIIETGEREPLAADLGNARASRMLLLTTQDARVARQQPIMLFDNPTSVHIIDNRVLVGQGPFTIVYRTR